MEEFMQGKLSTSGPIAKMLGLSPGKVSMLFDEGALEGHRLSSTEKIEGRRRIFENSALQLLGRMGYDFQLQHFQLYNGDKVDIVMPEGFLSVGKVAKITNLAPRTVVHFLERGIFNGYILRTNNNPNYNLHKICKRSLAQYLRTPGMSVDPELLREYNIPLQAQAA